MKGKCIFISQNNLEMFCILHKYTPKGSACMHMRDFCAESKNKGKLRFMRMKREKKAGFYLENSIFRYSLF